MYNATPAELNELGFRIISLMRRGLSEAGSYIRVAETLGVKAEDIYEPLQFLSFGVVPRRSVKEISDRVTAILKRHPSAKIIPSQSEFADSSDDDSDDLKVLELLSKNPTRGYDTLIQETDSAREITGRAITIYRQMNGLPRELLAKTIGIQDEELGLLEAGIISLQDMTPGLLSKLAAELPEGGDILQGFIRGSYQGLFHIDI